MMIFGLVPLVLLSLWLLSPFAIKKPFETFGLSEESIEKRKTHRNKTKANFYVGFKVLNVKKRKT